LDEDLGLDLKNTVYALDATTIDLCLSLFEWAPFRKAKAAVKLHTLLDLGGSIPAFIHISDGKMHEVNVLDILVLEPGAFYVMDRGYVDFARLFQMHQAGAFFVTRAKSNMNARRVYSTKVDRTSGIICGGATSSGMRSVISPVRTGTLGVEGCIHFQTSQPKPRMAAMPKPMFTRRRVRDRLPGKLLLKRPRGL